MEPPPKPLGTSLFQVYLRLRPPPTTTTGQSAANPQPIFPQLYSAERYLTVEEPCLESQDGMPTHITIRPPLESRKRAVEKFAFTKVFEEDATQLNIFSGTGIVPLIQGVLGADGKDGRDGLLATLGVTGSGKSHTILGSKSQRGLTQLTLDVLFRSLGDRLLHPTTTSSVSPSLSITDASECHLIPATVFLDTIYGDPQAERMCSRAPTPMLVGRDIPFHPSSMGLYPALLGLSTGGSPRGKDLGMTDHPSNTPRITRTVAKHKVGALKEGVSTLSISRRQMPPRPSALPLLPDVDSIEVAVDNEAEYAVMISMYEVYNDRIYDLLTGQGTVVMPSKTGTGKDLRRRPLLFKSTEHSPDRKVVAGLRKVLCGNLEEALMILETGLMERRVAGTGSNSVSSRSHGFFCVEVKKRNKHISGPWVGSTLTIVDLAGSERARNAKTAGATLAEAGKINESLMYLGQCLQMQSDSHDSSKAPIVPFRQCKLTELLFSNSFPSASSSSHQHMFTHRNAQKAIMIVTADPVGDFNATSQILRYSALAREVTVPRIPSVTSTILSGTVAKSQPPSGRTTPLSLSIEDLELAAQEIARLSEDLDVMQIRLAEEEKRRREAEAAWKEAEERCVGIEQDVREECWSEMEGRIEDERRRWKSAWDEEADRNDEHLDKKLDILTRSVQIHEDPEPTQDERALEIEDENIQLRQKVDQLERELQGRSPTKKKKQITVSIHDDYQDVENTVVKLNGLNLEEKPPMMRSPQQTPAKTPGKKQRKLTTRKWDLGMDVESP
ncbi:MAG: hypothetical protein M1812_000411 [Candelaria pacifica]|nr:MAG: hypothetical protein M1812_000411 [Candelaria pacifica]